MARTALTINDVPVLPGKASTAATASTDGHTIPGERGLVVAIYTGHTASPTVEVPSPGAEGYGL